MVSVRKEVWPITSVSLVLSSDPQISWEVNRKADIHIKRPVCDSVQFRLIDEIKRYHSIIGDGFPYGSTFNNIPDALRKKWNRDRLNRVFKERYG